MRILSIHGCCRKLGLRTGARMRSTTQATHRDSYKGRKRARGNAFTQGEHTAQLEQAAREGDAVLPPTCSAQFWHARVRLQVCTRKDIADVLDDSSKLQLYMKFKAIQSRPVVGTGPQIRQQKLVMFSVSCNSSKSLRSSQFHRSQVRQVIS